MWHDLLAALALVLVLEGLMPFANPRGFRQSLMMISQMKDGTLRNIGLFSMLAGVILLYIVR